MLRCKNCLFHHAEKGCPENEASPDRETELGDGEKIGALTLFVLNAPAVGSIASWASHLCKSGCPSLCLSWFGAQGVLSNAAS